MLILPNRKHHLFIFYLILIEKRINFQGYRIYLGRQLENHKVTISRIADLLGNTTSAKNHLNKCLFIVGIGSNDYINNFLMPDIYPTSHLYTPSQYATVLIEQYSQQLKVRIKLFFITYTYISILIMKNENTYMADVGILLVVGFVWRWSKKNHPFWTAPNRLHSRWVEKTQHTFMCWFNKWGSSIIQQKLKSSCWWS